MKIEQELSAASYDDDAEVDTVIGTVQLKRSTYSAIKAIAEAEAKSNVLLRQSRIKHLAALYVSCTKFASAIDGADISNPNEVKSLAVDWAEAHAEENAGLESAELLTSDGSCFVTPDAADTMQQVVEWEIEQIPGSVKEGDAEKYRKTQKRHLKSAAAHYSQCRFYRRDVQNMVDGKISVRGPRCSRLPRYVVDRKNEHSIPPENDCPESERADTRALYIWDKLSQKQRDQEHRKATIQQLAIDEMKRRYPSLKYWKMGLEKITEYSDLVKEYQGRDSFVVEFRKKVDDKMAEQSFHDLMAHRLTM